MNNLKRVVALLLSAALLTLLMTACGSASTDTESSGESLVISSDNGNLKALGDDPRVVGTSVATDEILDALEYDNVVGVPETDSFEIPERYDGVTSIGSPMQPDMEIVKSLKPDVVMSPRSLEGELSSQYDDIGVASYFVDLESLDGMYASIQDIGVLLGCEDKATELNEEYEAFKADLEESHSGDAPRVLILMGIPGSYIVATESSYVGSLCKLIGCENVYGDGDGKDFLNIDPEDMLKQDPDIILRTSHALPDQVQEMFEEEFKTNDIWSHFRAVEDERVYDLDHEYFGMSARFNYPEAIEILEKTIYEE